MAFKFIHAADIHLDRALKGLAFHSDTPTELLTATRTAFSRLIDEAIEQKVAFIIIAGDLYDTDWKDFGTGYFFLSEMARLRSVGIKVALLYGNHDAVQDMTKKLTLPDNVFCFNSLKPETFIFEEFKVALHGQSFSRADTTENLASSYPDPISGYTNIGVLHTAMQGRAPHAPYAPCSLNELKNKGYQYWALGHVHQYTVHCEAPWIVFPGNLQALHIYEPGVKGAVIVEFDGEVVSPPKRLCVDLVRWETIEVDVTGAPNLEDVVRRVREPFQSVMDKADGRAVCCRVILKGSTPTHGQLYEQGVQLRADIIGQAVIIDRDKLFVEKIKVETQPSLSENEIASRKDAVAELQFILGEAGNDKVFLDSLKNEFDIMRTKLLPEIWVQDSTSLRLVHDGKIEELIGSVASGVLDRVSSEVK